MKKFFAKSWKYFLVVPMILAVSIAIVCNVLGDDTDGGATGIALDLVSASDIEICVGESKEIECVVAYESVKLQYAVTDTAYAYVEDGEIFGVSAGQTTLTITASYNGDKETESVMVSVSEADTGNETEGGETEDISVSLYLNGDTTSLSELTLTAGVSAYLTVTTNSDSVRVTSVSVDGVTCTKIGGQYYLNCATAGSFTLVATLSDGTTREFSVIVSE